MMPNPSRTSVDQGKRGEDDFDLSNIFIARELQLLLFDSCIDRWKISLGKGTKANNETPISIIPSPHNKIQGLVVLLYGRGGFGKSTLLQRYRNIVSHENDTPYSSRVVASAIIDWETVPESRRSLFRLSPGKEINAQGYFNILHTQLASALSKQPDDFKQYKRTVSSVESARNQANKLIESIRGDERFSTLRGFAGTEVVNLLRRVPIAGGIINNQEIADAIKGFVGSGVEISAEQVIQLHARIQNKLGTRLGDYLEPDLKLGLSLGYDLREFAKNFPLLIFFDTYEEIDEGDYLLRIVMGAAGQRVGWVIAGRDNLWAGRDQRLRDIGIEYGYKEIVLSERGLAVDFNTGSIGAFIHSDLRVYFNEICRRAQYDPPLPQLTDDDIEHILDVTKGIPLAVSIAAVIYLKTMRVDNIIESVHGKHDIVDQMVRRYLLHVRDNEHDRAKLYGLALLRRADQPAPTSAAIGLTPEQAKTDFAFTNELSRLHRRYSFIFTEKEEPALHQEVRHFLRLSQLEHRTHPEIIAINEQLKAAHEQCLQNLEKRRQYRTLKERLQDDEWVGLYLDLTEQQFWLDPVEGVRFILPFMLAAAIYQRAANKEANEIGNFFAETITTPYRNWWAWASDSLVATTSLYLSPQELYKLEELEKLLRQQRLIFIGPFSAYRNELEAAIWWRLGDAYAGKDDNKALEWYEKALTRLNEESDLREAASRTYRSIAYQLYKEKKSAASLPFLNKAIELKPDYIIAYNLRGVVYAALNQYKQAIADYTIAISLDPNLVTAYYNRGNAYTTLNQYEQAIADYTIAISFDPNYAKTYNNQGVVYAILNQYEQAIANYTIAISLDPNLVIAYNNQGNAYKNLKQYEQAIVSYTSAISLDPNLVNTYLNRGNAYKNLNQYEQAIADFTSAISRDPSFAISYHNRGFAYLWLKNTIQAKNDYSRCYELDPANINALWMAEWSGMGKKRLGPEMVAQLEKIAKIDPEGYIAHICRGVALGLQRKLKEGLEEMGMAILLVPDMWEAFFWKGMLHIYYYQGQSHDNETIELFEKALELGLPPVLLTPLYWLEQDNPDFFERCAKPLLECYRV